MNKTFDAVAWMRQRRTQIDEEDGRLTWAQKRKKTHDEVLRDPLLAPLCAQTAAPEKAAPKARRKLSASDRRGRTRARRS
jgi:hypothetical protein